MENHVGVIAQEDCHNETLKGKLINEMKDGETCKDLFTQDIKQSEEKLTNAFKVKGRQRKKEMQISCRMLAFLEENRKDAKHYMKLLKMQKITKMAIS